MTTEREKNMRARSLTLPVNHPARIRARNYIRCHANCQESFNCGDYGQITPGAHFDHELPEIEAALDKAGA